MLGRTFSHYGILERLGQGGMGEVFLAKDLILKRKVALKFLPEDLEADARIQKRFLREARSAAALDHPYICHIHEVGSLQGRSFIAMEYVEGQTLQKKLAEGALELRAALKTATETAEALEVAHRENIVHRDLKPSNIMISNQGHAKVLDFGLAKRLEQESDKETGEETDSELTNEGAVIGTLPYMSPEQLRGEGIDARSDIFSFGVVLFEMFTGIHPFCKDCPTETVTAILRDDAPPLARFRTRVPDLLEHLVRKMLAKDPDQRYQSMHEVRTDLEELAEDTSRSGVIPSSPKPGPSGRSVGLVAIAFLLLLIGWWSWDGLRMLTSSREGDRTSIAVLPFDNLSPDSDSEYFSEGITEDITTQLSKISGLRVVSRNSALRYRDSDKSLRRIAEELGVGCILEGSVRRVDNKVRIVSQLIDASRDEHIWAETYDKDLTDIFEIQGDVARQVASALQTELTAVELERIETAPTSSLNAYDFYLKGRDFYSRHRYQDNENAIKLFERALELDPDYAVAYSGLADAYVRKHYQFGLPEEWVEKAMTLALRAISIDPNCAEAYKALGFAYTRKGWVQKSLEAYSKSVELNPNYTPAISNIAVILESKGQFEASLEWQKRSLSLNPTAAISYHNVGDIYRDLHDLASAEIWYGKALEVQPDYAPSIDGLVRISISGQQSSKARELVRMLLDAHPDSVPGNRTAGDIELFDGALEKAEQYYRKAIESSPGGFDAMSNLRLGQVLWMRGERDLGGTILTGFVDYQLRSLDEGNEHWWPRWVLAMVSAVRGNREGAYTWLEAAIEAGWRPKPEDWRAPEWDSLSKEARFQETLAELRHEIEEMRRRVEEGEDRTAPRSSS